MRYFLIQHNRRTGETATQVFADRHEASDELLVRESGRLPHVEVVLLMAESVEQLAKTHPRYFVRDQKMARDLSTLPI